MNKIYFQKGALTAAAAAVLLGLFSCHRQDNTEDQRQPYVIPDSLMRTIAIDTVKVSKIKYAIKFNGAVDFNQDKVINIFPLVSGTVQNVNVMPGDFVKAGQVLGTVRSGEMANYTSSLISAEANVRSTARQLQQQTDLFKSGMASEVDVTNARAAHDQAVAALVAAKRILSINGNSTNGDYIIKSPINGFVVQRNVNNGMAIRTDNGSPMFTISDLKQVWVEANVYEENISKVHKGDEVDVSTISYPDRVFKGKVNNLMNVLDPNTKVMKMRVILDNPDYLLKPQMFATVTVNNTENQEAIAISSADLVFDHSQYYVILFKGHGHVEIRPVDVLSVNGATAYIKSGVAPRDKLIGSKAILIYGSLNS